MRHLTFAVVGVLFAAAVIAGAQQPLRVDVRLVNVQATVTDSAGRYVGGLRAEDFTIEEDGAPQKIVHFTQDQDVPVSVGILIDTSVSMERKMRTATDAVNRFLKGIHKDDDIFLLGFGRRLDLLQDFTSDRNKLGKKMQSIDLTLGTVFYDAVREGLKKIRSGRHDKKALLAITDGVNAGGSTTRDQMLAAVRDAETLVYALGTAAETYADTTEHVPFSLETNPALGPLLGAHARNASRGAVRAQMDSVNMRVLNELGETSGGRAFLVAETFIGGTTAQMDKALTQIAEELRSQYTLGYYPASAGDGKFHNIRVTVSKAGASVRARRGYRAEGN
jgi:VWFA-related protein